MAPLTRMRADPVTRAPTELTAEYYVQRASAGLILAEATSVEPMGVGYPGTPGIWSRAQVEGWKHVTERGARRRRAHRLQLWHVGRISDPAFWAGPIRSRQRHRRGRPHQPCAAQASLPTPRALETDEMRKSSRRSNRARENAKAAGFDGVEIHGANGYLLDQFLQDKANRRDDEFGGSVENRARLHLAIADACIGVWGPSGWACTWRRAAIRTTWAIPIRPRPSAIWRASSAAGSRRICSCASTPPPTGSALS